MLSSPRQTITGLGLSWSMLECKFLMLRMGETQLFVDFPSGYPIHLRSDLSTFLYLEDCQ
jgi:hypothetical protein